MTFAPISARIHTQYSQPRGKIHRALVDVARLVAVSGKAHPGLSVTVAQSLDGVVGEALDDIGLA